MLLLQTVEDFVKMLAQRCFRACRQITMSGDTNNERQPIEHCVHGLENIRSSSQARCFGSASANPGSATPERWKKRAALHRTGRLKC